MKGYKPYLAVLILTIAALDVLIEMGETHKFVCFGMHQFSALCPLQIRCNPFISRHPIGRVDRPAFVPVLQRSLILSRSAANKREVQKNWHFFYPILGLMPHAMSEPMMSRKTEKVAKLNKYRKPSFSITLQLTKFGPLATGKSALMAAA